MSFRLSEAVRGLANYSRDYIEHYAEFTRPLYALMKIDNKKELPRKRNGALDGKKIDLEWPEGDDIFVKRVNEQREDADLS